MTERRQSAHHHLDDARRTGTSRRSLLGVVLAAAAAGVTSPHWGGGRTPAAAVVPTSIVPEDYGADVNAADNSAALNECLEQSVIQNLPLVMDNDYDVLEPVYVPSGAVWTGTGRVRNTYSGNPVPRRSAVVLGNYHPAHFDNLTYYDGLPVNAGAKNIRPADPADLANFAVGDLVYVRSKEFWLRVNNTNVTCPIYGSFNRVTGITANGTILLEFEWKRSVQNTQIAHADGSGIIDQAGLRPLYCCYGATIDGISIESVNGHPWGPGGMLGCAVHYGEVKGLTGVFANAFCFSDIEVDNVSVDYKIQDVAASSVGSTFEIHNAVYTKTARSLTVGLITHNESVFDNTFVYHTVDADDFDWPNNLIRIGIAEGMTMTIDSMTAANAVGNAVTIENTMVLPGDSTQPLTKDNSVTIGDFQGGPNLSRFVFYSNPGLHLSNCNVDGSYSGTVPGEAMLCAGDGHVIRGTYSDGSLDLGDGTNMDIDVSLPDGLVGCTGTANNTVVVNGAPPQSC